MELLQSINKHTFAILGKQTYDFKKKYRFLYYVFKEKRDDDIILFNTLTTEGLIVKEEELNDDLVNKYLVEHWFKVEEEHDDKAMVDSVRALACAMFRQNGIKVFTIFTTTGCNARCYYCFEAGCKTLNMTAETAKNTVEFIDKYRDKDKILTLKWFGGEPLLNTKAIDIIVDGLKEKNIKFKSTMITNGYLFDKDLIKHAKEHWNLKKAQITLDGTEDNYNKIKNYIGVKDSAYKTVLENIESLLKEGVYVPIRLNLTRDNFEDIMKLIDEIEEKFGHYKNCRVYSYMVTPDAKKAVENFQEDGFEVYNGFTEDELKDLVSKWDLVQTRIDSTMSDGKFHRVNTFRRFDCYAQVDTHININPLGKTFFCDSILDYKYAGDIDEPYKNKDDIKDLRELAEKYDKCTKCVMYPNCHKLKCCLAAEKNCPPTRFARNFNENYRQIVKNYKVYKKKGEKDEIEI